MTKTDDTERRLIAIFAADVDGYSRLMGADEVGTLRDLTQRRDVLDGLITSRRGRIANTAGDSVLAEFGSAVDAVQCAVEAQAALSQANVGLSPDRHINFRIGVHVGDVMIKGGDLFGDGVNIAARLQTLASAGGVCLSGVAYDQVRKILPFAFADLGAQQVKNIDETVRAFALVAERAAVVTASAKAPAPLALPDKPSIAVLPFDNMSAEAGQDYLADGIVEAITAALSCIRSFFVIARSSAFTYKGRATNARDIGKELGVAYLLEGSVQKAGNRLRIIVQLIETEGGAHVWSSRFDGAIEDFFDLEDRITEQVAGALQPSIRIAEIERSRRKRPQDLGSYDFTMRAMPHVWALEKEESAKALELLEKALAIDPKYPLALSLAGWCHAQRAVYNWVDDIAGSQLRARSLAERAAEMSSDDPIILAVLGTVHTFVRSYGTARVLLERAVALDPNGAWAWTRLGWLETYTDQPQKAIGHFERALRLSPIDPMNFNNYVGIGSAHIVAQEYDEAAAFYRRALEERPNASWIYRNLASSLSGAGRVEEAKQAFAELMCRYPDLTISKFKQAMVFSPAVLNRMAENLRKLGLPD
ncbi:adenylate/guanylate cyclase domain-containing protein [Bradyrhizobium sp.]|uniref:adenylate/guanylate cyclase domain-containing protein n=1 Tax=Bradyrhizobium sp. TaxID=376 RepID=UPI003C75308F